MMIKNMVFNMRSPSDSAVGILKMLLLNIDEVFRLEGKLASISITRMVLMASIKITKLT